MFSKIINCLEKSNTRMSKNHSKTNRIQQTYNTNEETDE